MRTRKQALIYCLALFVAVQTISLGIDSVLFGRWVVMKVWLHGLAGPFSVFVRYERFQYQSFGSNLLYLIFTGVILVAPFAYVIKPRKLMLAVSVVGMVAWVLWGFIHSIDHM